MFKPLETSRHLFPNTTTLPPEKDHFWASPPLQLWTTTAAPSELPLAVRHLAEESIKERTWRSNDGPSLPLVSPGSRRSCPLNLIHKASVNCYRNLLYSDTYTGVWPSTRPAKSVATDTAIARKVCIFSIIQMRSLTSTKRWNQCAPLEGRSNCCVRLGEGQTYKKGLKV